MTSFAEQAALPSPANIRRFLILSAIWNVVLFGVIRLAWVDRHFISALVDLQVSIVRWYAGAPRVGLSVTSSCSGADVMALCIGVTLAYPVAWRRRLLGALGGTALVLVLNAVRIATLYAARTPQALEQLHVYVWPIVLALGVIAYLVWWLRRVGHAGFGSRRVTTRLFHALTVSLLGYAALVPWAFTSPALRRVGAWTVRVGAATIALFGTTAHAMGPVLVTARGAFEVTPECLFTPALPLFLAAVCATPMTRRRRLMWLSATAPLFFAMGVARLLVLAVPPFLVDRPTFIAHGFYQILTGAGLVVVAAHLALRHASVWRIAQRVALAVVGAIAVAAACGAIWHAGLVSIAAVVHRVEPATLVALSTPDDQQGALAMLPAFQLALTAGLFLALTGGRRPWRLVAAITLLAVQQVALLVGAGWFVAHVHAPLHAVAIRALAVGVPVIIAFVCLRSRHVPQDERAYRQFWQDVGDTFPTLTGAASTDFYFENEKRLLTECLPTLGGVTLLKTDLWDEAKNTRILQWVAQQGARVHGIDLSEPIVRQARAAFAGEPLRAVVSDVRGLPFADRSFDAIYSMGTVEHVADTAACVRELARVLAPGGRLILGVPNRLDPFLRPAFVWCLSRFGLYAYGAEKSFSRKALRRLLEQAGLDVVAESGILFMPGWLRMLDLWCHTRWRPLTAVTRPLVQLFACLDRHVPALRRHGYLIASVGVKVPVGIEYVVDARGCRPDDLRSQPQLKRVLQAIVDDLALRPVAEPAWHIFPGPGGITGAILLAESHLTIHTYPEFGLATVNLYACRRVVDWPWASRLGTLLGATTVSVRTLRRGGPLRPSEGGD